MHGYRAKLQRAQELLDALALEVSQFVELAKQSSVVTKTHEQGDREYVISVRASQVAPERFSVLAGEIIHHLRSSLDHLVTSLVVANGGSIGRWHQFPICATRKAFKDSIRMRSLDDIKPSSLALVEAVQPFTQPNPDDTVLTVVQAFDNQDKHRLLLVTSAVTALHHTMTIGTNPDIAPPVERQGRVPAILGFSEFGAKQLSESGVRILSIVLQEPSPDFYVDAEVVFDVCFQQCGSVEFASLVATLQGIVTGVANTIDGFAGEF